MNQDQKQCLLETETKTTLNTRGLLKTLYVCQASAVNPAASEEEIILLSSQRGNGFLEH